jgi:hypothetical protein
MQTPHIEKIVQELVSNPVYLHWCEAVESFTKGYKPKGNLSNHPDIYVEEEEGIGYRIYRKKEHDQFNILYDEIDQLTEQLNKIGHDGFFGRKFMGSPKKAKRKPLEDLIREKDNKMHKLHAELDIFPKHTWSGEEYFVNNRKPNQSKVFGYNLGSSYIFSLHTWNKEHHEITYVLAIPSDKKQEIVPQIKQNPEILIEAFRKAYPELDQGQGIVRIKRDGVNIEALK